MQPRYRTTYRPTRDTNEGENIKEGDKHKQEKAEHAELCIRSNLRGYTT